MIDINHLIEWVTLWFLRNGKAGLDIGAHVREFRDGITALSEGLGGALPAHYMKDVKKRAQPYIDQGVPEALALRIANLVNLYSACDIVRLANRRRLGVDDVARIYFGIGTHFPLRLSRLFNVGLELDRVGAGREVGSGRSGDAEKAAADGDVLFVGAGNNDAGRIAIRRGITGEADIARHEVHGIPCHGGRVLDVGGRDVALLGLVEQLQDAADDHQQDDHRHH